jgi:hypothetical protein
MNNTSLDPRSATLKEVVAYSSLSPVGTHWSAADTETVNKQRTAHVSCKAPKQM